MEERQKIIEEINRVLWSGATTKQLEKILRSGRNELTDKEMGGV